MDPILVPVVAALAGLAVRSIALAALLARLRWQERRQREHRAYLTALARELPPGCQFDEVRADGSTLHLVTAPTASPTDGLAVAHPALLGAAPAPRPPRAGQPW